MQEALCEFWVSDTATGTFRFHQRHCHDFHLLAIVGQRHMHSTRGTRESGKVIRNVLPREAHWSKAVLAAIYGYCGSAGQVQVEETRFDGVHHCACHSYAIRGPQG